MGPVSLSRPSSQLMRASRRARKKGYSNVAADLFKMSELARLGEPNTIRPEHRYMELQAANIERAIELSRYGSGLDPEEDIAPLPPTFFSDIEAMRGLSPTAKATATSRYSDRLGTKWDKVSESQKQRASAQVARLQLQGAVDASKIQQEANEKIPALVEQLRPIVESPRSALAKTHQIDLLKLDNANILTDPRVQQIFKTTTMDIGEQATVERQMGLMGAKERYKGYEDAIARLDTIDKEVTSSVDDFASGKGSGDALFEADVDITPELYRKMQYVRVLNLLRELIGISAFSRLVEGDVIETDIEKLDAATIAPAFQALVTLVRDNITNRRPSTTARSATSTALARAFE